MQTAVFRDLACLSPDAMVLLARDGTILAANAVAEASLFSTGEPVVGRRLADLSRDPPGQIADYLARCALSGDPLAGVTRLRRPDVADLEVRMWGVQSSPSASGAAGSGATIVLRLQPSAAGNAPPRLLDQSLAIDALGREVARRHATEIELRAATAQLTALAREVEETAERLASLQTLTDALLRASHLADVAAAAVAQSTAHLETVTAAFSQALTPGDVAHVVSTECRSVLGAARASVWLLADDALVIDMLAVAGCGDDLLHTARQMALTEASPLTDALHSTSALFFETPAELSGRYPAVDTVQAAEVHASVVAPLAIRGEVIGVLSFGFDEPHRFDAEDRAFVVEIARACARALDRARLYDEAVSARFDAEVANRAKDDFLSTISHELRSPLTAVLGWANILRARTGDAAAVARGLAIIERNARAQAQLIEDILDVSRMATGKLRLEIGIADPATIVRAAVEMILPAAEVRGVAIAVSVDPEVGFLAADPARLEQIAVNLVSNAVKFTPRGGRIEVRLDRLDDHVRLRVADDGIGIEPELLSRVFDQFRQGDSRSTRSHGGLGLGLAIVKHLVELHDGAIVVESAGAGCGATLTVTLPLAPRASQLNVASGSDPPTPALLRLDGVRVLIVDDDADTRELIATVLEEQGANTAVAGSAAEALASILLAAPHVLVSDVGMPDEDGYSLLRRVRAVMPIPAIALTAYTGPHDARMAELAGFDRHLTKPIVPARLVDAIARLAAPHRST